MVYAIISDVHANCAAFRDAIADTEFCHADRIVVLGDVVGYGPDPLACLELVREKADIVLMGNHDAAVAGLMDTDDFSVCSAEGVASHRKSLPQVYLDYLAALPPVWASEDGDLACVHGYFGEPFDFRYIETVEDARECFNVRSERILFAGHTHEPAIFLLDPSGAIVKIKAQDFAFDPGMRYLVNVGTCGYPRGEAYGTYVIYDQYKECVYFRYLPFDLNEYTRRMRAAGMDAAALVARRELRRRRRITQATTAAAVCAAVLAVAAGTAFMLSSKKGSAPRQRLEIVEVEKVKVVEAERKIALRRVYEIPRDVSRVAVVVKVVRGSAPADAEFWFEDANGGKMEQTSKMRNPLIKQSWSPHRSAGGFPVPQGAVRAVLEIADREGGTEGLEISGPEAGERVGGATASPGAKAGGGRKK